MKKKIAIGAIILGIFILVFACGILFIDDDSEPEQPVFLAPTAILTKTVIPTNTLEPTNTSIPPTIKPVEKCDSAYPDFCIPPPSPDLDCKDITEKKFKVLPPDPHGFDTDGDGIGCES